MNQFDHHGESDRFFGAGTEEFGGEESQSGSEPFPSKFADVLEDFCDLWRSRRKFPGQLFLELLQARRNGLTSASKCLFVGFDGGVDRAGTLGSDCRIVHRIVGG
jgi:hypothetical protein